MNIFSSHNKIYFHPNTTERIEFLNNPRAIIEEEDAGLLKFEVFGITGILIAFIPQVIVLMSEWFVKNVNWQDVNLANLSYVLYFLLVFLACVPFQHSKKQFVYNPKNIKLIAVYALLISVFTNLFPVIKNASLIFQDFSGKNDFLVRMFIKSQTSRIINMFIYGFFFAVLLFVVFIAVGNFIIKRRIKKDSESRVIA
jgi:cation transport ATPase